MASAASRATTVYRLDTGQIVGSYDTVPPAFTPAAGYGTVAGTHYANAFYVNPATGIATAKPLMDVKADKLALKVGEVATFSGMPPGTQCTDGQTADASGTIAYTATAAGTVTLGFILFPYIPRQIALEVS